MSASDFKYKRQKLQRRSAKAIVEKYAEELLARAHCNDTDAKLIALEHIALQMSWNKLYDRLRFRNLKKPQIGALTIEAVGLGGPDEEPKEPWWTK